MIKVDENDSIGEVDPAFSFKDVQIRRGEDVKKYYDLEGEIGRGKFGIVYKCRDKETKLVLAAKFVSIAKRQDRKNVEREVEIMRTLRHPRLIQLYDAFENENTMCVVLEMIDGGELFERVIDDDFILTEKACTVFMRQICEGVAFIHSNNIIHLDLKPENILCLTKTGNRIKIIDFGLARKFDPDKKLQVLFGTPEFVAPEVVNFDQISCATDMWSVGVICYVLLSGLSPFMGENDIETMSNVTLGKYDFDDEAFDDISAQAKDFISQLLVKDKEKRLTGEAALVHPWLYRKIPPPPPFLNTTKDNLKNYLDSTICVDQNLQSKSSNRKSMLNAIQILADSEKHFLNNIHKAHPVIENKPHLSVVNNIKPIRPEPLRCDLTHNTVEPPTNNSANIYPTNKAPLVGENSEKPNGKPESLVQLASNQLPFNTSNQDSIVITKDAGPPTVKTDAPTIPLPDSLASLLPHEDIPCDKRELIFKKSDDTEKVDEIQSTSQNWNETKFSITPVEESKAKPTSVKTDSINFLKQEQTDSKTLTKQTNEKEISLLDNTKLEESERKNLPHFQPELSGKMAIEHEEECANEKMKENVVKSKQNLETMLPKINESLASAIEAPVFSPLTNNKLTMDTTEKKCILEISSGSLPTPLSILDKVKLKEAPKVPCFKVDLKENESSVKRNNISEILQNSLGYNISQKINLEKDDARVNKEKRNIEKGGNLETLFQNPHPKILGIRLGQTSFDETTNMRQTFTNFNKSSEFKSFEETCDKQKTRSKKESCSSFVSTNEETITFKQHLKSIPPWFSESSNIKSTQFDKDISSLIQNESTNAMWSHHIDQLSARVLEMSKDDSVEASKNKFTHNQDEGISWISSKNKNTNRKPKYKFSMMNRDVPIGSPPEEGGREFYLNRPFFVLPNRDTQSPSKCLSADKKSANNQCWKNSCHSSVLKMVSSEENQESFTTESTVKNLSSIFNTD